MEESAKKDNSRVMIKGKLDVLAHRFDGFYDGLHAEQTRKIQELNDRFEDVHIKIKNLDHSLKLEAKNNKTQMKALKSWLETRFVEFHKSIVDPIHEKFEKVDERFEKIQSNIDVVAKKEIEDIKAAKIALAEAQLDLNQKINDFRRKFDEAMQGIEENRQQVMLKLLEQKRSLVKQVVEEKEARVKIEQHLAEEIAAEEKVRAKGQKTLRVSIEKERAILAALIAEETKAREKADEMLVKAVTHYSAALQDAVKKVAE